ncbi:MAG: alpha-galactosidase [Candidatus Nealsonbacteria bacterium]|nr:alpha-galactosidase [Candidatus Nealsonbacteria bacterium]
MRPPRKQLTIVFVMVSAAVSVLGLPGLVSATTATDDEMTTAGQWIATRFEDIGESVPPFSFIYAGKPSAELLPSWKRTRRVRKLDDRRSEHTLAWTDPESGLVVRCVAIAYRDFPTVEWTLYFKNTGKADTPILKDIQPLDVTWQRGGDCEFLLHHAIGSPANGSDYGPLETALGPRASKRIAAAGGRPTNSDLSYFNLEWGAAGVILAVGWPGQWAAEFARDNDTGIHVRAGQELTHFKLRPGEEVRTPLIALLFWQGDWIRAQNLWRRWMMAHSMPKPGGKLPPPQFVASSSRAYEEMIGANEANQIMHIDRYLEEDLKIDYWWMDAGWYIQQHGWPQVGTWQVDPKRFPRGLRPISDHAHAKGLKTLLWFEPERVMPGTWLYEHHQEWLLRPTPGREHPLAGLCAWSSSGLDGSDPCVTHNPTPHTRSMADIRWEPGRLSFHPGPKGEYSVVRFTVPQAGDYSAQASFLAIDKKATTDVYVLHRGRSVFDGSIRAEDDRKLSKYDKRLTLAKGDTLDFVVGWGNGTHICDSTGLEVELTGPSGNAHNAAKEFHAAENPAGPWSYGYLKPAATPDADTFVRYDRPTKADDHGVRLLDLGNPAARQWLTEHIDNLLVEQGIGLYRQDFNMDPLAFWRAADAADRQGITEIRHVTGLLAYWDELRRRHPNMLIDTCASGGRRNDLETLRRAVPLWRSDYAFEPVGHQCMTYGISFWIPYHGTGTVACANAGYYGGGLTPVEPYAFWSNAAPSLGSGIDIRVKEIDYDALRRLVGQWRNTNANYYGDYYPLTPYSRANNVWIAWQFHRPEAGEGAVQAFRRADCPKATVRLKLRGLQPDSRYEVENLDAAGVIVMRGADLMTDGLSVAVPHRPGVAVVTYKRAEPRP